MAAVMFDSLEAARELEAAGVERNHAAAMVKTVVAATEAGRKDLATKTDLAQLESRLEAKFAALEIMYGPPRFCKRSSIRVTKR